MKNMTRLIGLLAILLFVLGCKKDNVTESSKTTFYFRGKINGVYKNWTVADYKNGDNLSYRYNAASGVDTLGNDCENTYCKYMFESADIFQNNKTGTAKNYIATGFYVSSKTGNRSEIIDRFSIGQKVFGKPRTTISDPVKDGAFVYYIDENGKEWCSHFGTGDQTNSVFTSEQLLNQPYTEILCRNIWRVTFSCMLYDGNGYSIRLENCEIYTPVLVNL